MGRTGRAHLGQRARYRDDADQYRPALQNQPERSHVPTGRAQRLELLCESRMGNLRVRQRGGPAESRYFAATLAAMLETDEGVPRRAALQTDAGRAVGTAHLE